jgi:hypothetical protein
VDLSPALASPAVANVDRLRNRPQPSKLPKPKVPSPMLWIKFRQDSNGKNVMDEILVGPSLLYGIAAIVAAITGHAVLPSVLHWIK